MPDGSWIQIEDLKGILDQFRPEILHPEDPKYVPLWRTLKAKCTNGIWYPQFNGLRFVPGRLGFFGVFGRFYDWSPRKERIVITPKVRDLEWHRAYYRTEMDGFSGFYNDDKYTSDSIIFEASKTDRKNIPEERWLQLFNSNGQFKEYIPPRENLFMIHEDIGVDRGHPLYYNDAKNHCELGCHAKGTRVRMFDGGLKNVENIRVGDKLMGPDGTPRKVIKLFNGIDNLYKVNQIYRNPYIVNSKHLLHLQKKRSYKGGYKIENIETDLFYRHQDIKTYNYKYEALKARAIPYKEKNLKIHPYFIGLWLGDGFKREKLICFCEDEIEIKKWLIAYAKSNPDRYSYTIKEYKSQLGTKKMFRFRLIDNTMLSKNNYWSTVFRNNKHIPEDYLLSSIDQRLDLLAGLLDSDGNYESDTYRYTFTNTDENLIKQVESLCWSLGFRTKIVQNRSGITNSIRFQLRIYGSIWKIPCRIKRKKAEIQTSKNRQGCKRDRISIEHIGKGEFFGFELDGDHLYLLEDYTITHNCRGGGKSYWTALGDILADLCMDGSKYFDPENPVITTRAEIEVTCGGNEKSTEMLDKVVFGMNALADPKYPELGVFKYNEEDIEPCPFWKEMTGSYGTNNKGNPWINEYSIKRGNKWDHGAGNRDVVYNTQYAPNAKAAAQKSAGGRRTYVVHEEFGLNTEIESAWGSNEGMVTDSGHKQAGQKGIGTSGNIETILGAKKIMNNPKGFSCLVFEYNGSEHCWFLPTYMVDMKHKDENGNTNIEAAKEKALKIRQEKAESNEPSVYLEHIMNNPFYIDDMWVQGQGNLLPALEAEAREKELMQDGLYKELGTPIELFWDNMQPRGINYRIDKDAVPFYEYPFEPNRTTKRTVFMMYIHPSKLEVHGHIPNDAVIAVHDPYVSDEMDKGGSLGATYFVVNPKYIKDGLPGNCIAASLLGKAPNGVDDYNRMLHLGLYFYGDPIGCLWYEANRGDKLRSYFLRQKKLNSLCLRPQFEQGQYLYLRNVAQTGYMVSGQSRIFLLDAFSDWLLEDTELTIDGQTETKKNIQRIPCMFLLKQIKLYNQKENFDAVDAMQGLPLALGEQRHRIEAKTQSNSFSVISNYLKERRYARR